MKVRKTYLSKLFYNIKIGIIMICAGIFMIFKGFLPFLPIPASRRAAKNFINWYINQQNELIHSKKKLDFQKKLR